MVAYSMSSAPASGSGGDANISNNDSSAISAASRNAIVGIVVGCAALAAIIVGAVMGTKAYKRQRREKLMNSKIEKNPIVDVVPSSSSSPDRYSPDRWASRPSMV